MLPLPSSSFSSPFFSCGCGCLVGQDGECCCRYFGCGEGPECYREYSSPAVVSSPRGAKGDMQQPSPRSYSMFTVSSRPPFTPFNLTIDETAVPQVSMLALMVSPSVPLRLWSPSASIARCTSGSSSSIAKLSTSGKRSGVSARYSISYRGMRHLLICQSRLPVSHLFFSYHRDRGNTYGDSVIP